MCDYEVSTIQEEHGTHRIVLICQECERNYVVSDAFGEILPPRLVAELMIKATAPR